MPNCKTFEKLAKQIKEAQQQSQLLPSPKELINQIISTITSEFDNDVELAKLFKNYIVQNMPNDLSKQILEFNQNNNQLLQQFISHVFIKEYLSQDIKDDITEQLRVEVDHYLSENIQIFNKIATLYINILIDWINQCLTSSLSPKVDLLKALTLKIKLQKPIVQIDPLKTAIKEVIAKVAAGAIEIHLENEKIFEYNTHNGLIHCNHSAFSLTEQDKLDIHFYWKLIESDQFLNFGFRNFNSTITMDFKERINRNVSVYINGLLGSNNENREITYVYKGFNCCELGRYGSKAFLDELNKKFIAELKQGSTKNRFTLYIPNNQLQSQLIIEIDLIEGILEHIKQCIAVDKKYLFPCEYLILTADQLVSSKLKTNAIDSLIEMIRLLDITGLNHLIISFNTIDGRKISVEEIEQLAAAISNLTCTHIKFSQNSLDFKDIIRLEGVNQQALRQSQIKSHRLLINDLKNVSIDAHENKEAVVKIDSQNNTNTISRLDERRQALDEVEIQLPFTMKPGLQRQHQVEHKHRQQQQVSTQQAWQRDIAKSTTKESIKGGFLHGDEQLNLFTRNHIFIALDSNHPEHLKYRSKLGEEICNYNYMGRSILDLWDRICGYHDLNKVFSESTLPFSQYNIKAITKSALLQIVKYPHDFQYGVNVLDPASGFAFSHSEGALYIDKQFKSQSQLAARMVSTQYPKELTADYYYDVTELFADKLTKSVYIELLEMVGPYHAWRLFSRYFDVLIHFELFAKTSSLSVIKKLSNKPSELVVYLIEYLLAVYQYCYEYIQKMRVTPYHLSQHEFELRLKQNFNQSQLKRYEQDLCTILADVDREFIFSSATTYIKICNITINNSSELNKNLEKFLLAIIKRGNPTFESQLNIHHLEILQEMTSINLLAFIQTVISNNAEAGSLMFDLLIKIYQVQGREGFNHFKKVFLDPLYTFTELLTPETLNNILLMLKFTDKELNWWQTLTTQHVSISGYGNFTDLFNGFRCFLLTLKDMKLDALLPYSCPLQNVGHLKLGLKRLLIILNKSINPVEQLANLDGISLNVMDAIYASYVKEYHIVTKEMRLNINDELAFVKFMQQCRSDVSTHSIYNDNSAHPFVTLLDKIPNYDQAYEYAIICFYRYLAEQKYINSFDHYKELVENLHIPPYWHLARSITLCKSDDKEYISYTENKSDHTQLKMQLLAIIAYATTGKRNMENVPTTASARKLYLNTFVDSVLQISKFRENEEKWQKHAHNLIEFKQLDYLLDQLLGIVQFNIRPSLTELTYLLQLINNAINLHDADRKTIQYDVLLANSVHNELRSRIDNQCLLALQYIKEYQTDFLRVIVILHNNNQRSDFAYYLKFIEILKMHKLTSALNITLIRLLALVELSAITSGQELKDLNGFIDEIIKLKELTSVEDFASFLTMMSRLNFQSAEIPPLTFARITQFVKKCAVECTKKKLLVNVSESIRKDYFKGYILDIDADDLQDAQFYADEMSLDKAYPGLGTYYKDLKKLLLAHFTYNNINQRASNWNAFLNYIHQLSTKYPNEIGNLLNVLKQSNWQDCLITGVNNVLFFVIFETGKYQHLPYEILSGLNKDFINKCDEKNGLFLPFFNHWLGCMDAPLSSISKTIILQLASLLAIFPDGADWLEPIKAIYPMIVAVNQNKQYGEDVFENLFYSLLSINQNSFTAKYFGYVLITVARIYNDIMVLQQFQLSKIVIDLLKNYQNYPEFYSELYRVQNSHSFLDIMFILARSEINTSIDCKETIDYLMQLSPDNIKSIATLYYTPPYPHERRLAKLAKNKIQLNEFLKQHIIDPHGHRDNKTLEQQFDSGHVNPYIKKIQFLDENIDLNSLSEELYMQFIIINNIGRDYVRCMTMEQMKNILHEFRSRFVQTNRQSIERDQLLSIMLIAIAVAREAIYRCSNARSPLWSTPIQMLTTICLINNMIQPQRPLYFKAAMGEGKSLIAVTHAIFSWINGGSVVIVKHKSNLAYRDYMFFKKLYDALNISSAVISANSKPQDYFADGIHFAEFMDCALFRQSVMLDTGKDLNQLNTTDNKNNRISFIVDEADEIILHNDIDCNLTTANHEMADIHPYAWIFDFLIDYLGNGGHNFSEEARRSQFFTVRLGHLQQKLAGKYPQYKDDIDSNELRDKLKTWVRSAWTAILLREKYDYLIKTKEIEINGAKHTEGYAAIIIHDKRMPTNVTFSAGVQECLHARLNKQFMAEKNPLYFRVATEKTTRFSMNPKAVLDWMQSMGGDFIMMSATTGAPAERAEMGALFGFRFIKLPKKERSTRVIKPDYFCKNRADQFATILHWSAFYTDVNREPHKRHAILIPVESIEKAEELARCFRENTKTKTASITVLHADIDNIDDEQITELEIQAAESGHITIATSGFIQRGFDPQPQRGSKHQVVVLHTFLISDAATKQESGRCARIDPDTSKRRRGKSFGIYNIEAEIKRHGADQINIKDAYNHPERFKALQYLYGYQKKSAQRIFRQIEGEVINFIQSSFNIIWQMCKQINEEFIEAYRHASDADFAAKFAQFKQFQDELLNGYSAYLTKLMSVKPSALDNSVLTQISSDKQSLKENNLLLTVMPFNDAAFTTWLEFLAVNLNKLSQISLYNNEKLNKLITLFINAAASEQQKQILITSQSKIMKARAAGQAAGEQNIQFKIHNKWGPGLGTLTAYLNPGKQSFFSKVAGSVTEKYLLPAEYRELLIANRTQQKQKLILKQQKRWHFTTLAQSYLGLSAESDAKMKLLMVKIYKVFSQLSIVSDKANLSYNNQLSEFGDYSFKFNNGCAIIVLNRSDRFEFGFNPFTEGYKIKLCTNKMNLVSQLEEFIIKALIESGYTGELPISIKSVQQKDNKNMVMIECDFTSKLFRHFNRAIFIINIASQLTVITHALRILQPVIQKCIDLPLPSITIQNNLLNDLQLKVGAEVIKIMPVIKKMNFNSLTNAQMNELFIDVIQKARDYEGGFFAKKHLVINALAHYADFYKYHDEKGRESVAVVKPFNNLDELMLNHSKRLIVAQINELITQSLTAIDLLTKLQKQCFFELLNNIIDAESNINVANIYQTWSNCLIKYNNQEISYRALMSIKVKSSSEEFCKKIDAAFQIKTISEKRFIFSP